MLSTRSLPGTAVTMHGSRAQHCPHGSVAAHRPRCGRCSLEHPDHSSLTSGLQGTSANPFRCPQGRGQYPPPPPPLECRASSPKTRAGPDQAHNVWAPAIQGGPGSIRPRRGSSRFHWAPPCTMMSTTHLQAVPTFKGIYQTSTVAQTSPLLSQL